MKRVYKNCDIRFAVDKYQIKENFTLKFFTNDEANAIVKTQNDVEFEDLKRFIWLDYSDLKFLGTGCLNFICTNDDVIDEYDDGFSATTDYYICNSTTASGTSSKDIVERKITSLEIPDNVTEIGSYAFAYWSGLTNVIIPNGVTTIGERSFQNCSGLTNITIPESVTTIEQYAFYLGNHLETITVLNSIPPTLGSGAFQYSNVVVYVPDESVEAYQNATNWSNYTIKGISEK